MIKLIILNYSSAEVHVYQCPEGDIEHYEDWITTHTEHRISEISYMTATEFNLQVH